MDTALDASVYARRRARLAARLGNGVAIVPTAPECLRNRDAHYPYRYDSYFYYLTGFREPEAVLVLVGGETPRSMLFCREKNAEREIWDGFRYGPEAAREAFAFDEACSITELDARMPDLLADRPAVQVHLGSDPLWDGRVLGWVNAVRGRARSGVAAPGDLRDVRVLLDEMRLIKDGHEVALMRRAGYHVWLVSDLTGSYEQQPPDLLSELQRDRRWCQGNLQNSRLMAEPGSHRVHRTMFALGAMSYLSAPLWLAVLTNGPDKIVSSSDIASKEI